MKYHAIIFFDGPLSKWLRGGQQAMGTDVCSYPEPDLTEIIARKSFRWRWMAEVWVISRLRGLHNLSAEIRRK